MHPSARPRTDSAPLHSSKTDRTSRPELFAATASETRHTSGSGTRSEAVPPGIASRIGTPVPIGCCSCEFRSQEHLVDILHARLPFGETWVGCCNSVVQE